jgi:hypothetical protein
MLYDKILQLHSLDRNGMWWQILGNAFAPMLQGSFDIVVGNPPWVTWETLPERYRRDNDAQWLLYGLRPGVPLDRRQASAQVRLDLAMLFVARSMDKLLRAGGRLAFLMTATAFKSELAGRGFRRRRLPDGTYRLCRARLSFRAFEPGREDWLGLYSVTQAAVAEHKVVYREIAQGLIAARRFIRHA